MSQIKSDLFLRYEKSCDFNREVSSKEIKISLRKWFKLLGIKVDVREIGSFRAAGDARVTRDPRAARAARDAMAARDVRDAWDARDAWDVGAAWDTRAARAGRDAWDAWAAGAARDARDNWAARAAWDASYNSIICIGAEDINNIELKNKWLPYFEAFEYGAWMTVHLDTEVLYLPIPKIKKNEKNKCHADLEPALVLPEEKWYFLNGVSVPEYLVMTKKEDLDIEFFKKEKNAEIRTQFIKKYGIDRMKSLGQEKDKKGTYELIDMSQLFSSSKYAPYLFMVNPSTGEIHAEGVHPNCKTVAQAIGWRAGDIDKKWEPLVLT